MARTALTPGRLYSLLSAQFRAARGRDCGACTMPMPCRCVPEDEDGANWTVGKSPLCCEDCETLIHGLVAAVSGRYDLFDPTSEPIFRGVARPAGPCRAESA